MTVVFLLTLVSVAPFEYEDIPTIEDTMVFGIKGYFVPESRVSGFQLAGIATILIFEYLRSHIGEKRFSEETINVGNRFSLVGF